MQYDSVKQRIRGQVSFFRCDVGAESEVADSAASFGAGGRIAGVLHASGVLHDAIISQQSAALVREVYAAKSAHHLLNVRCVPCILRQHCSDAVLHDFV